MATRKLEVQIIGDSRSLERAFARSARSGQQFQTQMTGGVAKVESSFSRLKNVAAGGFFGGVVATAAVAGIKSVVQAAADSQQVLGQTRVALEATGNSWAQYGKQIQDTVRAQSHLGFDDEALLRTFSLFVRQSNDVSQALKENSLAMDVARGRYISLEQAANLVNKAALGNAGALRRLGIDTKNASTGTQLLTLLTEKYGGAAVAAGNDASTAFQRAQVDIQNAKEDIGAGLLPTVAGLANTLSDTINLFEQLGGVKIPPIHIPMFFDTSINTGGGTVSGLVHKAVFTLPEFVNLTKDVVNNLLDNWRQATDHATADAASKFGQILDGFTTNVINDALTGPRKPAVPTAVKGFGTGLTPQDLYGPLIKGITQSQTEALLNAQLSGSRNAVLQVLKGTRSSLQNALNDPRLKQAGRIGLKQALKGVNDQIQGILDQVQAETDAANQAAQDRRDAKRQAEQTRRERQRQQREAERQKRERQHAAQLALAQQRQFRAIGLAPTGQELVPTAANLQKQFAALSKRVIGEDVPKNLRDRLRKVGRFLHGDLKGITEDTRRAIQELFATIRGTFDQESKKSQGPLTKTTSLNVQAALAGVTGLDRNQLRQIRANLSSFNNAGIALAPSGSAGGGGFNFTSHTFVTLDGAVVAQSVTKHQQKNARRNPKQKRGPNRGGA